MSLYPLSEWIPRRQSGSVRSNLNWMAGWLILYSAICHRLGLTCYLGHTLLILAVSRNVTQKHGSLPTSLHSVTFWCRENALLSKMRRMLGHCLFELEERNPHSTWLRKLQWFRMQCERTALKGRLFKFTVAFDRYASFIPDGISRRYDILEYYTSTLDDIVEKKPIPKV